MTTCGYGLCRRPAEIEISFQGGGSDMPPLQVCGLHVTPVVSWGVPAPIEHVLRVIAQTHAA